MKELRTFYKSRRDHHSVKNAVRDLLRFLNEPKPTIEIFKSVTYLQVCEFVDWMRELPGRAARVKYPGSHKRSDAHIVTRIAELRAVFDHLIRVGALDSNPFKVYRFPKIRNRKRPGRPIPWEKVIRILKNIPSDTPRSLLHKTVLLTFFSAALRRNEVIKLRLDDVRVDGKYLFLNLRDTKSGGSQLQEVGELGIEYLLQWYKFRLKQGARAQDFLFTVPSTGFVNPLSESYIRQIWQLWFSEETVGFKTSTHAARHTVCTELFKAGVDAVHVQAFMRHKHLHTTLEYLHWVHEGEKSPARKLKP